MKQYIKKFDTPSLAHRYKISDIPFITSVATDPILNLHCNIEDKVLINHSGTVTVEDFLIIFTVTDEYGYEDPSTYTAENGMSFEEWVNSEYNTDEYYVNNDNYIGHLRKNFHGRNVFCEIRNDTSEVNAVDKSDIIQANYDYYERNPINEH